METKQLGRRLQDAFSWPVIVSFALSGILLLISYCALGPPTQADGEPLLFWRTSTHEAGFAFAVSALIWVCFEFYKSTQEDDHWNHRIEEISKSVFFGVWKRNFPKPLIDAAGSLILDQKFIRTDLHLTYTVMDETVSINGAPTQFVKLNAIATCVVKNVSNGPENLPLGISLPNPMIDELKPFSVLNKITVKKKGGKAEVISEQTFLEAQKKFRAGMADDRNSQVLLDLGHITVLRDEEVEMMLNYNMAKEIEDSEVFTTTIPADSVSLTILDQGITKRVIRARAIHQSGLENHTSESAPGTYSFKLMHYLLPMQGFVIWWKSVPNRSIPLKVEE